ncbi:UBC12 [Mytilus edulis]|uniref:E2 NEDD8-conjugating enzyme n=1 Tax=Mytilus edulis TaxID=6550 RepID=A0A8S3S798_MYTED|nr:UBC12 [Mytilus edulis]
MKVVVEGEQSEEATVQTESHKAQSYIARTIAIPLPYKRPSRQAIHISNINELNLPKTCQLDFPDQDDLLTFKLTICPDEGFYRGGRFVFSFKVGQGYPHDPPKVKCETMVYHPNIDLEGNVCLNILREDWKPVLTINSIVYGLQYLFLEPNPEDPLNKEAADVLQNNRRLFEQNVSKSMRGGYIGSTMFDRFFGTSLDLSIGVWMCIG